MVPVTCDNAHQVNTNQSGTNNWAGRFGPNDERIIANELMTDVNRLGRRELTEHRAISGDCVSPGFRAPQVFIVPVDQRRAITAIDKIQL